MITRSQMRRQLRAQGGIMNVAPRKNFLFGGLGDRIRKLIPNEIANVAVKAAPFVAPFNPGIAGLMRGIGRFDQRGSISDALKQGLATTAFGAGARYLGGAENVMGGGLTDFSSPIGQERGLGKFLQGRDTGSDYGQFDRRMTNKTIENQAKKKVSGLIETGTDFLSDKVPGFGKLDQIVQEKLLVGGITSGATYLYEKFLGDEPPQDEGETYEQYIARRKENVGRKMRTYMDNYFANDPEYMQLDDAGRDAFVARYNVRDGGRIGYQTGGITMANTLQQNIAANRAQAAGIQNLLNQARASAGLPTVQVPAQTTTAAPTQTTAAAPAPSITKSTSAPAQTAAPAQGLAPMAMIPQMAPAQMTSSQMASALPTYSGLNIDDSTTQAEFDKLSDRDQLLALDVFGGSGRFGYGKEGVDPMDKNTPGSAFNPLPELKRRNIFYVDPILDKNPLNLPGGFGTLYTGTTSAPSGSGQGIIIDGKMYRNEIEAIRDVGIDKFAQYYSKGGRVGFEEGGTNFMKWLKANYGLEVKDLDMNEYSKLSREFNNENPDPEETGRKKNAGGGIMGMPMGEPRVNKGGITELDYRAKGGFVPVGIKEKADDVPAMLSKNEFVMTANAVRGAGNGSIEKGAQKMYDTMKNLERRVT